MLRLLSIVAIVFTLAFGAHARPAYADNGATAGNAAGAVKSGTSPDTWFKDAKQSNWDVTDKISGGMAQILSQALIDFGSYEPHGPCESAAATQAWNALADAANAGPLEGFLDAIKGALKGIKKVATFGADPSAAADAIEAGKLAEQAFEEAKSKGSEWLKARLKEIWKGKSVEVLKRVSNRGGCEAILVAIWDKAAQTYEITIYGDCKCALVPDWKGTHTVMLKTFAVQLKGTVVEDIADGERVLHVGFPKITVVANCDCKAGGVTARPPTGGGTSVTPGGQTATAPNTPDGWRKLKTDCKPCQSIVDKIHAVQAERDGMDSEFRDAMSELEAAKSRGDKAETSAAQARVNALTAREAGLIKLEQELYRQLKACEKEKCPEHPAGQAAPAAPPIDKDSNLQPVPPGPGQNKGSASGVSLPPWAGAGSEIVVNVNPNDEPEGGANGVLLVTEDQTGHKRFFQGKGNAGRIAILAGLAEGVLRAIELVKGFDEHGNPITGSRCEIGTPAHIEGTQAVANVASNQPAISEASSSMQPGDITRVHIQGNNPLDTRFTLSGKPVKVLAVSNNSAVVQIDKSTALGRADFVMHSGGASSQPLTINVVQLVPHPVSASRPGVTETVTIEVAGLGPSDQATMYFAIEGDAATVAGGGMTATVPVTDGRAELRLIGKHAGQVQLRFRLVVKNPQFVVQQ